MEPKIKMNEKEEELVNKEKNIEAERKFKQVEVKDDLNLKDIHYYEVLKYDEDKTLDIYHLIIANEDSEAGKEYNKYAYDFIENYYNTITQKVKFDIFEEIKDKFQEISKIIINNKISKEYFNSNEEIFKNELIKLNLKDKLSLKRCYMDELGFSFFKTGDFEPKLNYFNIKRWNIRN